MWANSAKTWLRLGISAGLLVVLLLFFVDLKQAWRVVANARWEFLVLLLAAFTLDRCLMSYKWRLLLVSQGYKAGHGEALRAYYLASFAGCFLPSTLGADALRVGLFAPAGPPQPGGGGQHLSGAGPGLRGRRLGRGYRPGAVGGHHLRIARPVFLLVLRLFGRGLPWRCY